MSALNSPGRRRWTFRDAGQKYKVELRSKTCRRTCPFPATARGIHGPVHGPHVLSTGRLVGEADEPGGRLLAGSEKNKMLQRIYGTSFPKSPRWMSTFS